MWGNLSKYTPLFLVLAVSGLVLLLCNIHTLEKFNCQTVSALYQLQTKLDSAFRSSGLLQLDRNRTYCGLLGPELTADEAAEERHLLESVAWPEPRTSPAPFRQSSDPSRSFFVILSSGGEWRAGGQLEALVHMHDFLGKPKRHGGDFLLARLLSPELRAGVAGRVVDHQNGFYSLLFWLPWAGPAQVEVVLVHPSEAVQVLRRLREERPDRVFFKSLFRSGYFSETTVCNLCLPPGQPLCNYTDRHTGEPWFCYKPKLLGCDTRINHAKGGYQKDLLTSQEALLFQSDINIKVPIPSSGPDRVTVLPERKEKPESERSVKAETAKFMPSGFYYQGTWQSTGGVPIQQFNDTAAITDCLRGKVVNIYGDSTARQWFEYLNAFVPDLKEFNLRSPKNVGPFLSVDSEHNILLKYRCHGPPIRFSTVAASELRYVSNELEGLAGGRGTVVVVTVWSHFSTFPVEVYVRRLRNIRRAVLRLLDRAPETLVFLRSANLQALDPDVSLYNSDWYSLQLDAVLRAMFRGLPVVLVDAWEMTLAHGLPHNLHPPPTVVKSMIDVFLSHVCPRRRGL
ncbi:NXPE family member 3 isoform X1 [Conger conger]|uniref:NXPE family member 3 isoform X1 n=1 Tax=Conger conger TaxID=82655 RepID=UPI002A59D8B1|nr:NXPE family member 3 isoform X1 [Conger conger]XP_061082583.1 NXPE family member 3 isoform X1 [Conger conger]XP_061082584.1 NXPE family member 3 isoform X1 [Conger conger]